MRMKNKMSKTTLLNQLQNKLARKTLKMKKTNSQLLRSILNPNLNLQNLVLSASILKLKRATTKKILSKRRIIKNKQLKKMKMNNQEAVIPTFNTNAATVQSSLSWSKLVQHINVPTVVSNLMHVLFARINFKEQTIAKSTSAANTHLNICQLRNIAQNAKFKWIL